MSQPIIEPRPHKGKADAKVKEAARIEDRPLTMAPQASITSGLQFFRDKCVSEDDARRQGFHSIDILEARELLLTLQSVYRFANLQDRRSAELLEKYNIK